MQDDLSTHLPGPSNGWVSSFRRHAGLMLIWAVAGLVLMPIGLVMWWELSGTPTDLGSLPVLYGYAPLGLVLGAALGAALARGSDRVRARALAMGVIVDVAIVVFFIFAYLF